MQSLEDITGQREAISRVLSFSEGTRKRFALVCGRQDSGVSWTLAQIASQWQASSGVALQASGQSYGVGRSLFPWLLMASPGAKGIARLEALKGGLVESGKTIPVVGPVAGYLVEELLNRRKHQLAHEALLLTGQEQEILFILQNAVGQKRLPIIWGSDFTIRVRRWRLPVTAAPRNSSALSESSASSPESAST